LSLPCAKSHIWVDNQGVIKTLKTKEMTYFNIKTGNEVETFDELDPKDFKTRKDYRVEVRRLKSEYALCVTGCYTSTRCTKDWRNR